MEMMARARVPLARSARQPEPRRPRLMRFRYGERNSFRDTARAMSQENVEIVRAGHSRRSNRSGTSMATLGLAATKRTIFSCMNAPGVAGVYEGAGWLSVRSLRRHRGRGSLDYLRMDIERTEGRGAQSDYPCLPGVWLYFHGRCQWPVHAPSRDRERPMHVSRRARSGAFKCFLDRGRSPRSRRAVGVGDVAGERGGCAPWLRSLPASRSRDASRAVPLRAVTGSEVSKLQLLFQPRPNPRSRRGVRVGPK